MIWRWMVALAVLFFLIMVGATQMGCAPRIEYQPVPHWLIPTKPVVATVQADSLQCLSEETYTRLAERDRACWQYARELRALLEAAP